MKIRFNFPINTKSCYRYNRLKKTVINNNSAYDSATAGNNKSLDMCSFYISNISFNGSSTSSPYSLNLDHEELLKRTDKTNLVPVTMLEKNSPEYHSLAEGDKKALVHLIKAGKLIETVYRRLDNQNNIPFENWLNSQIKQGNSDAEMTKILYEAQGGICGTDHRMRDVNLASGIKKTKGKGFYPGDLGADEFHKILINMLNNGKIEEVRNILNQRSVVERSGSELKSSDYTDIFKPEFLLIADELDKAAETSTDDNFNEFLKLQSKALRINDPMADAYADKKWSELQYTPLEFTITRENYEDELTGTVFENPELASLLTKYNIVPVPKDSIGCRVGIVNREGTDEILKFKKYLPVLAENMPYNDEYVQSFSDSNDIKQTMVDADIVFLSGDLRAYKVGIPIAENLPNSDKLSFSIGGGKRNVYHIQVREDNSPDAQQVKQDKLNAVLNKEQQRYYDDEYYNKIVIGHENAHSLGPSENLTALGIYKSIIEENKADMAAIAMLDLLIEKGRYTEEDKKKILTVFAVKNLIKAKPDLSQAHRVRSVMQNYYFEKEGVYTYDKNGILTVNFDKAVNAAEKMLKEIIRIQIDGDFKKAEKFINDNFIWTRNMQIIADNCNGIDKSLNRIVVQPLAEELLSEV